MRIAILGTRGVPAAYGGFETFAEELGARLVSAGHSVTVYGRSHFVDPTLKTYRGMRLRILPTVRQKYLDTVVHTALSVVDCLQHRYDAVLICNNANAPFAAIPRLVGSAVVLNVDGLEWQRDKWGFAGRSYYRMCAWLAPKLPVTLVTDARVIARWYETRYRKETVFIPYGTAVQRAAAGGTLRRIGLEPGRYLLYVSRLEPENNAHVVVEAYGRLASHIPLVIVGDAPYANTYKRRLESMAAETPGVVMVGYVFGEGYAELQSNAAIYIQATEVGGTHPALVEAMGRGACVLANDVPEHREVLGDAGAYYRRNDAADLAAALQRLIQSDSARETFGRLAAERAAALYSWDRVTQLYGDLLARLVGIARP